MDKTEKKYGMGENICANPLCQYYKQTPYGDRPFVYVANQDFEKILVKRYLYIQQNVGEFFLCHVCHNAVLMVK